MEKLVTGTKGGLAAAAGARSWDSEHFYRRAWGLYLTMGTPVACCCFLMVHIALVSQVCTAHSLKVAAKHSAGCRPPRGHVVPLAEYCSRRVPCKAFPACRFNVSEDQNVVAMFVRARQGLRCECRGTEERRFKGPVGNVWIE